jgi:hypothetical protein
LEIAIDHNIGSADKAHHGGLALNQQDLPKILGPSLVNFATDTYSDRRRRDEKNGTSNRRPTRSLTL